jgi:hypothetical protein
MIIVCIQPLYFSELDESGSPLNYRQAAAEDVEKGKRYYHSLKDNPGVPDRSKPCDRDGNLLNQSESTR